MKKFKYIAILSILAMLFTAVSPAFAQLGQTDISSFTVQNIDTIVASVKIHFFNDSGTEFIPTQLTSVAPIQPNPFTLDPGDSYIVYVPSIPAAQLPDGRYSVMIESTARVATIANLLGQGTVNFNGSYSGFSEAASTFYLPGVVFNFYGWYSLISAQNVGGSLTNITLTITCSNGAIGTITATDVKPFASHHFVLKQTTPTGFTSSTSCNGSAVITSTSGDIVVTDNQSVPAYGNTQSYSGVSSGAPEVFIPALYTNFYGWNASLNIQKLGAGATNVSVAFSDGGSASCSLSDSMPSCLLYMPTVHPAKGAFGATVTASLPLMVIANAANGSQAQTYNGVYSGSMSVGIPSLMKDFYDWNTSFTCQNVGSTTTTLNIVYEGYPGNVVTSAALVPGATTGEVYTPSVLFLPAGYNGGATVTANTAGSEISCIVNFNNGTQMFSSAGDWSMSYNAINK